MFSYSYYSAIDVDNKHILIQAIISEFYLLGIDLNNYELNSFLLLNTISTYSERKLNE
jgi:hypothetical protein